MWNWPRIIESALGVVAGGIVFGVWLYITVDLFGIALSKDGGLSAYEWFLFMVGIVFLTLVMAVAGCYAVEATKEYDDEL